MIERNRRRLKSMAVGRLNAHELSSSHLERARGTGEGGKTRCIPVINTKISPLVDLRYSINNQSTACIVFLLFSTRDEDNLAEAHQHRLVLFSLFVFDKMNK